MGEGLAGVDCRTIHELERDGDDAGADDGVHAGAGDLVGGEGDQHGARAPSGAVQDAHDDLGDDEKLALACR